MRYFPEKSEKVKKQAIPQSTGQMSLETLCRINCKEQFPDDPWDAPYSSLELWEENAVWDKEKRCIRELHFYGHGVPANMDVDPTYPDSIEVYSRGDTHDTYFLSLEVFFPNEELITQVHEDLCDVATLYLHGCYTGNNQELMRKLGERSSKIKKVCGWTGRLTEIEFWGTSWLIVHQGGDMVCIDVNGYM